MLPDSVLVTMNLQGLPSSTYRIEVLATIHPQENLIFVVCVSEPSVYLNTLSMIQLFLDIVLEPKDLYSAVLVFSWDSVEGCFPLSILV